LKVLLIKAFGEGPDRFTPEQDVQIIMCDYSISRGVDASIEFFKLRSRLLDAVFIIAPIEIGYDIADR
jgi:hypothetical protein